MKKVAIMQPYFFPYIGYFQLIHAVDAFVIYDDVNFIKQGWIARNRIMLNGREHMIILQLSGAGSFVKIKDIRIGMNRPVIWKTVQQAYSRAPLYEEVSPLIESALLHPALNLVDYLEYQIQSLIDYMGISADVIRSSEIPKDESLQGVAKVIHICRELGAQTYINAIGGRDLYNADVFEQAQLQIRFVRAKECPYKQLHGGWMPWLSIIDLLMNCPKCEMASQLSSYEIISP